MAHRATRAVVPGRLRVAVPGRLWASAPDAALPEGPHIRLGLLWSVMTGVAAAAGPVPLAMLFAPLSALSAMQAARSWRRRQRRAAPPVSAAGAALVATASIFGVVAVGAAALIVAAFLAFVQLISPPAPRRISPALTCVIALSCGLAGAAPVLLRADGFILVFVMLSFVHVYDASAYVVGAGAGSPWEGPAAGAASIAAVTLAVAAVLSPPFRGASPWLFGLLAAALVPLGPVAAAELTGDPRARVPALRRLDSLLVMGPVWALAAVVVLD